MPSMALNAIRPNIQKGISTKARVSGSRQATHAPITSETTAAVTVTWLAVMPARAMIPTSGRSQAWKRGFSA